MTTFDAEDFLLVRERGRGLDAAGRAVSLLAATAADGEALWRLPLGQRNERLLELRVALFGRQMEAFAECPHCGEALEFSLDAAALRGEEREPPASLTLETGGYEVRFRLLDSIDWKAAAACESVAAARALLFELCVLEARRGEQPVAAAELPESVVEAVGERIEEADPHAETTLELSCPACGGSWQLALDVASFLYSEIEGEARRVLQEVHALARGYGWSERDILAMPAARRREYLEMLLQ